eukprot:m.4848 g.4848  ORF g.4848 m.4848 type:complete len:660 (+) comp3117_c0_seq1:234-2213(+)
MAEVAQTPQSGWWAPNYPTATRLPPVIACDDERFLVNHPSLTKDINTWLSNIKVLDNLVKEILLDVDRHHNAFMEQRSSDRKMTKILKRSTSSGLFPQGCGQALSAMGSTLEELVDKLDALPEQTIPEKNANFSIISNEFEVVRTLSASHEEALKTEERAFQRYCAAEASSTSDTRGAKAFVARTVRETRSRELVSSMTNVGKATSPAFIQRLVKHFKSRHAVAKLNAEYYERLINQLDKYEDVISHELQEGLQLNSSQKEKMRVVKKDTEMLQEEDMKTLPNEARRLAAAGTPTFCDTLFDKLSIGDVAPASPGPTRSRLSTKILRSFQKKDGVTSGSTTPTTIKRFSFTKDPTPVYLQTRLDQREKSGWVHMSTRSTTTSKAPQGKLVKCFLAIKGTSLYTVEATKEELLAPLNLANVRICDPATTGKKFSFEIATPGTSLKITVDCLRELIEWVTILQATVSTALGRHDSETSGGTHLYTFSHVDGNKKCADCNAPRPEWCAINLGILFCIKCSGSHRSLGATISKVRSLNMDKFSENIKSFMLSVGNGQSNAYFEANMGENTKPDPDCDEATRSKFIREKYVDFKFALKQELPDWVVSRDSRSSASIRDSVYSSTSVGSESRGPVGMVLSSREINDSPPWELDEFNADRKRIQSL